MNQRVADIRNNDLKYPGRSQASTSSPYPARSRVKKNQESPVWAITSYFNPAGYRRRIQNYRYFHHALEIPLITVEWSPNGNYELQTGDADILVQVPTGDNLWQKEKLLNIALDHLPDACEYVAWLDCDLIFPHQGWSETACDLLENHTLIQLYNMALHLPALNLGDYPNPENLDSSKVIFREACLVEQYLKGEAVLASPSRSKLDGDFSSRGAPGMAWAARRDLLESSRFYDACIIGGGDSALALAGLGESASTIPRLNMTSSQADHYMAWAESFYEAVKCEVGCLPYPVYHLWHGSLSDRKSQERFNILQKFEFNPDIHLLHTSKEGWQWDEAPEQLRKEVSAYFRLRNEDGA